MIGLFNVQGCMNNSKNMKKFPWRVADSPTTNLPLGYPAYCIYVPTGMNEDFEKNILTKLQVWGESMGKNLYVAPWNIGDPSYIELMKKIGFQNKPAIILTDSENIDRNSFLLVLDDPLLVRDEPKLTEILPSLLDFILKGEYKNATKAAIEAQKISKIKSLSKTFESILNKVKITFSWKGIVMESK